MGYQPNTPQYVQVAAPPIFTNIVVLAIVFVGIIMIFLGFMIGTSILFQSNPTPDMVRSTTGTGRIMVEIGGLLACLGFFGGAINNEKLDISIKVAFISAGISFIITVLIVVDVFGSLGV